jgi:hypothetical protein
MSTFNTFNYSNTNAFSTISFIKQISNQDSVCSTSSDKYEHDRKNSSNSNSNFNFSNKQQYNFTNFNLTGNDSQSTISSSSCSNEEGSSGKGKGGKEGFGKVHKSSSSNSSTNEPSNDCCFEEEKKDSVNSMVNIINYTPEILSKVQEYNRICNEAKELERTIKMLHNTKLSKQNKIEDLRCLISRIASEESINRESRRSFVKQQDNGCFVQRERRDKKSKANGIVQNCLPSTTTSTTTTETTTNDNIEEAQAGDDCAPINQDLYHYNNRYLYHFTMCSMYWQENFSQSSLLPLSLCKQA